MKTKEKYVRFDWAMKRLLRDKANYAVLEGLLTTVLNDKIKINRLLESESNQEDKFDKFNRVDILAESSTGELFIVEVQNNTEYAYFQRMLFGTSKLVTEYINRGEGLRLKLRAIKPSIRGKLRVKLRSKITRNPRERQFAYGAQVRSE